jgi:cell division topological specificity factor MinE
MYKRVTVVVSQASWVCTRSVSVLCQRLSGPDFLPDLQKDLVAVISKYFPINPDDIKVGLEKQSHYEVLEVNIVLPEGR